MRLGTHRGGGRGVDHSSAILYSMLRAKGKGDRWSLDRLCLLCTRQDGHDQCARAQISISIMELIDS
eukprot:scaffold66647_cov48-Tisochrysis_lutea.AAC.2